jgi:hypothetical protein
LLAHAAATAVERSLIRVMPPGSFAKLSKTKAATRNPPHPRASDSARVENPVLLTSGFGSYDSLLSAMLE